MNIVTTLHLFGCNVSYRLQHVIGFELILRACQYMFLFKVYCFFYRNWWYRSLRETSNDVLLICSNRLLSQFVVSFFPPFLCTNLTFPNLHLIKMMFFYVWYVYMFSICCSDSPYLLWRMTMYIRSCIFILWKWGHHSAFWVICVMIDAE